MEERRETGHGPSPHYRGRHLESVSTEDGATLCFLGVELLHAFSAHVNDKHAVCSTLRLVVLVLPRAASRASGA